MTFEHTCTIVVSKIYISIYFSNQNNAVYYVCSKSFQNYHLAEVCYGRTNMLIQMTKTTGKPLVNSVAKNRIGCEPRSRKLNLPVLQKLWRRWSSRARTVQSLSSVIHSAWLSFLHVAWPSHLLSLWTTLIDLLTQRTLIIETDFEEITINWWNLSNQYSKIWYHDKFELTLIETRKRLSQYLQKISFWNPKTKMAALCLFPWKLITTSFSH
mgnify:FL=1